MSDADLALAIAVLRVVRASAPGELLTQDATLTMSRRSKENHLARIQAIPTATRKNRVIPDGESSQPADRVHQEPRPEPLAYADSASSVVVQALSRDVLLKGVSLDIHAADEMLRFFVFSQGHDPEQAVAMYLSSGQCIWEIVRQIIVWRFGSLARCERLLDFASGYGRVTRHIVADLPRESVWVSDIYAEGVDFLVRHFGVHGIVSASDPDAFRCDQKFQCILVSSLFTHLPPATFTKWLERLGSMLTADGLLLFSVHDMALHRGAPPCAAGIIFQEMSESASLTPAEYGTAWVTEEFVRRAVRDALGNCAVLRVPRGLANFQDLYVVLSAARQEPPASLWSTLRIEYRADGLVEHCSRVGRRGLRLAGWVGDRVHGEPPREVRIRIDGALVACCRDLQPRPPVREVFAVDPMIAVGWEAAVQLPEDSHPDLAELSVRPVTRAGDEMALFSDSIVGALLRSAQLDCLTLEREAGREVTSRAEMEATLSARISEREGRISERDARIGELTIRIADREARTGELTARIADREAQFAHRDAELTGRISAMAGSRFWKLRNLWFRFKRAVGLTDE